MISGDHKYCRLNLIQQRLQHVATALFRDVPCAAIDNYPVVIKQYEVARRRGEAQEQKCIQ